jgi:predicted O-methyltransferase YrrM
MDQVLQSIFATWSVQTEDGSVRPLHSNISQEEGNFLQDLIRRVQPEVTLEVGCAFGVSSLFICEALREVNATKHIIIDPMQHSSRWAGIGRANLRRAGYTDLVEFHEVPSYQCLARLTEQGMKIDFAFIDGQHTFDYVLVDFFLVDKLLKPGGIVVLDDFAYPSIRDVCRYALTNLCYQCVGPPPPQMPLWRKHARRLYRRVHRDGIGGVVTAPLRRIVSQGSPSDRQLKLPNHYDVGYAALQKLRDDYIDEVPEATRHWRDYRPF